MGPAESGSALVRRLLAEIAVDRGALADRTAEVRRFSAPAAAPSPERVGALALALDRAYTALEPLLERVARTLEGGAPTGDDWHRALLQNAGLEIERVRPTILGGPSHETPVLDAESGLRSLVAIGPSKRVRDPCEARRGRGALGSGLTAQTDRSRRSTDRATRSTAIADQGAWCGPLGIP